MRQPFHFNFIDGHLVRMRGLPPDHLLQAGSPPRALPPMNPRFVLPEVSSCNPMAHPELPYIDGSRFKVGQHLGRGIDKSAYELLDEEGEPRTDVVLKVARFSNHCDDSQQCRREVDLWSWLISVEHPLRGMFAEVVAIVENVVVSDLGEETRTCYLCEYVKKRELESPEMGRVKNKLAAYFGVYDLHRNNLGMTEDGRHVVLDYGLSSGLDKVKKSWADACQALGDDATPEKILAEVTPINTLKSGCYSSSNHDNDIWCSSCDEAVSYSHCRCTCCRDERRGGMLCYACQTVTNESSRLTDETYEEIRCHTCLSLARQEHHASQCHPEGSTGWRMHASCNCDECRNARNCFELARGRRMHIYPESKWCYRPQCPCQWCNRARSENARLYENVRVSVHRLESAPPLEPLAKLGDNILKSPLKFSTQKVR